MKLQEKIETEGLAMRKDHLQRFYDSLDRQRALEAQGMSAHQAVRDMILSAADQGAATIF
jgi:hypothetical protein